MNGVLHSVGVWQHMVWGENEISTIKENFILKSIKSEKAVTLSYMLEFACTVFTESSTTS